MGDEDTGIRIRYIFHQGFSDSSIHHSALDVDDLLGEQIDIKDRDDAEAQSELHRKGDNTAEYGSEPCPAAFFPRATSDEFSNHSAYNWSNDQPEQRWRQEESNARANQCADRSFPTSSEFARSPVTEE